MLAQARSRITYANVAATLALFIALGGGTAFAVVAANQVVSSSIKNGQVKKRDLGAKAVVRSKLALNSVNGAKVADGSLTGADIFANSLTGAQINESTLALNVSGGPCPAGQFVRDLSSGAALTCGPTTNNSAFGLGTLQANTTGNSNSAVGKDALSTNTTGSNNSVLGTFALSSNTTGSSNSALGQLALSSNTTGNANSAFGTNALSSNTTGYRNLAVGYGALSSNTTGDQNSAVGSGALNDSTTGSFNTALGANAGQSLTTGSNNIDIDNDGVAAESDTIRIGDTQTSAYLAGVFGATSPSGVPVVVNSGGHLGTGTSSRRFKRDIRAIGAGSDRLMELRPVSFHYKRQYLDGPDQLQYGLIAEEVAKVYPNLVAYGRDAKPYTVRYQELPALLLAKVQKQERQIGAARVENRRLKAQVRWLMRHARLR